MSSSPTPFISSEFCAILMAVLLIGATMADFWEEFRSSRGYEVMALGTMVRNVICPAAFVALAWLLPISRDLEGDRDCPGGHARGRLHPALIRHNGGNVRVALQVIFATSAAALITLPLCIHFAMKCVGLSRATENHQP